MRQITLLPYQERILTECRRARMPLESSASSIYATMLKAVERDATRNSVTTRFLLAAACQSDELWIDERGINRDD